MLLTTLLRFDQHFKDIFEIIVSEMTKAGTLKTIRRYESLKSLLIVEIQLATTGIKINLKKLYTP